MRACVRVRIRGLAPGKHLWIDTDELALAGDRPGCERIARAVASHDAVAYAGVIQFDFAKVFICAETSRARGVGRQRRRHG